MGTTGASSALGMNLMENVGMLRKRQNQSAARTQQALAEIARGDQVRHSNQRKRTRITREVQADQNRTVASVLGGAAALAVELLSTRELGLIALTSESAARAFGSREFALGGIAAGVQRATSAASADVGDHKALNEVRTQQGRNMADSSHLHHTRSEAVEEVQEEATIEETVERTESVRIV